MSLSVVKKVLTCFAMFLIVACQMNIPETGKDNLPSPFANSATGALFEEDRLVDVYEQIYPGVVSIRTVVEARMLLGSGFVLDREGHVLTNSHVVAGGGKIEVVFSSGNQVEGEIIGFDEKSDLAVLKINEESANLYPLTLGDSEEVRIGQFVLAVGNPLGLQSTLTLGIVSGLGRAFRMYGKVNEEQAFANASVIQTDAAINQGNSGGPLLDLNGKVIGINSSQLTSGFDESVSGIGFSTSSHVIKVIAPHLIRHGKFNYPYLGISSIGDMSLADRKALGLDQAKGVYIAEVEKGGPAESAGLIPGTQISRIPGIGSGGDLIVKADGHEITNFEELMVYIVLGKIPGEKMVLTVLRGAEQYEIEIILGTRVR